MSEYFRIQGLAGRRALRGDIDVRGAKNVALQAFAFSLLFTDTLVLKNIPEIADVESMLLMLQGLGVRTKHIRRGVYELDPHAVTRKPFPEEVVSRLRASIVAVGPFVARMHAASFPHPGGCAIGARPIDLFLDGFRHFGVAVREKAGGRYELRAPQGLRAADIYLRTKSVTATQTLMMAAVLARGTSVIKNAAREPEIAHLASFLNRCGARIHGAGTDAITVWGGGLLSAGGRAYTALPDRIEAGSFLLLGVLAGRDVRVRRMRPEHIELLIHTLRDITTAKITTGRDWVRVRNTKPLRIKAVSIKTNEYPGFPTDLQAPMAVLLTQAEGESLVFETIFEGRLGYTLNLRKMGADITNCDPHRILIRGKTPLLGRTVESPDLRAGLAYILAAAIAKGESLIHNVYYVDRGYEHIEERVSRLGLDIKRLDA